MTERPPRRKSTKSDSGSTQERPRIGGPRAIADLMPQIGDAAFRRFGFVQSSIVTRWAEIVGDRYASVSEPESIRFPVGSKSDGTLNLLVMSGHAPMMQHVMPEIMERVNRFFGYRAVARIAIRQGEVHRAEPLRRPPPRMLQPMPADLGDSVRQITDPELRAVLESMALGLAAAGPPPKSSNN